MTGHCPIPKIEIAFTTPPDDPSPAWVDITRFVRGIEGLSMDHGRHDELEAMTEDVLSLVLINSDGRFTPDNINSPYYPNVKKGRMCRVTVSDDGVTYPRFSGYVNEWPVTWHDASATVSNIRSSRFASSRMARLSKSAIMRSIVENEYLFDGPSAYYPMGEPEGAVAAGNVSDSVRPQMSKVPFGGGTTANITFGTGTGPGTDSLTAPQFTRVSASAGAYLSMETTETLTSLGNGCRVLEAFFLASTAQEMGIAAIDGGESRPYIDTLVLGIDSTGHLTARLVNGASTFWTLTSANIVTNGQTHHGAVREVQDGSGITVDLILDGVSVANTTVAGRTNDESYRLRGGGNGLSASAFAGTLSHVAITWSAATITTSRINQHYLSGNTGFAGEGSGARLARLCTYAHVPTASTDFDTGLSTSLDRQDTSGKTPLDLMQDVASTEHGVLFDGTDGILTFHDRAHRYNTAPSFTLYGNQLLSTLEPTLDDQFLVNDISASRQGGVALRVVDTVSVTDYGTYRHDLNLLTTSDAEVFDAATWRLYLHSTPQVRIAVVELELAAATHALKAQVLGAEISDRITLSGLPAQAPASSLDFFIEGWSETVTAESYRISFFLSNAVGATVWQLDSSIYSVLGVSTRLGY